MSEPYVRESLKKWGVVVVEGMNDVIRLEELGVAAVGLGSNKVTERQVEKIIRFAREVTNNRVTLFPDCDQEGEAGFKELLWQLTAARITVGLAVSQATHQGRFRDTQPEDLKMDDLDLITAEMLQFVNREKLA